jgi:hypothetical protein
MNFYLWALVIALVILIICLIGIGILMQYQNAGMKFPLHPNPCPDLWNITTDNNCVSNGNNVGSITAGTSIPKLASSSATDICKSYKLARQYNINWDGVSNYNGCS